MLTIVAFLQCQWFPARSLAAIERAYLHHGATPEGRARLNARYLFFRCLTGRRLRAALGEARCDRIVWENASPRIATEASGAFPPDVDHVVSVIEHFRPGLVLAFGKPALLGATRALPRLSFALQVRGGPHPAARHATVVQELAAVARDVEAAEGQHEYVARGEVAGA